MGILVYSLLWVMQDLYHPPYYYYCCCCCYYATTAPMSGLSEVMLEGIRPGGGAFDTFWLRLEHEQRIVRTSRPTLHIRNTCALFMRESQTVTVTGPGPSPETLNPKS